MIGWLARARRDPWARAALAYLVYGTVYLVGAIMELDPARQRTFWGFVPWWAFYALGAAFVLTFPVYISRGVRWLTVAAAKPWAMP